MNPESASGSENLAVLSLGSQMYSGNKRLWESSCSSAEEHSANLWGFCLICGASLLGNGWALKGSHSWDAHGLAALLKPFLTVSRHEVKIIVITKCKLYEVNSFT